jgi:hypothetical protein
MTDTARFVVDHAFDLSLRATFCVLGGIAEGVIAPGMVATADPDDAPVFREPIDLVELADSPGRRRSWVGLGFRYADPAERDRWRRMDWAGVTLRIASTPILHPCPCCGYRSMESEERGSYAICPVCDWEDDGAQFHDPDYRGGANADSLNEARAAFRTAHPHPRTSKEG